MTAFVARGTGVARGIPAGEFGPLGEFVTQPDVTDVFLNGDGTVWVDRGAGVVVAEGVRVPAAVARDLAVRLVALGGRHLDEAAPAVDVRLGDGVRVHAVLPPVSAGGALVSMRLPAEVRPALEDLDGAGFFALVPVGRIRLLVDRRANLLVTGAGGSGKGPRRRPRSPLRPAARLPLRPVVARSDLPVLRPRRLLVLDHGRHDHQPEADRRRRVGRRDG
jgi:pilus assembly protein CpaF